MSRLERIAVPRFATHWRTAKHRRFHRAIHGWHRAGFVGEVWQGPFGITDHSGRTSTGGGPSLPGSHDNSVRRRSLRPQILSAQGMFVSVRKASPNFRHRAVVDRADETLELIRTNISVRSLSLNMACSAAARLWLSTYRRLSSPSKGVTNRTRQMSLAQFKMGAHQIELSTRLIHEGWRNGFVSHQCGLWRRSSSASSNCAFASLTLISKGLDPAPL